MTGNKNCIKNPSAFPQSLVEMPQWVCWQYIERDGRMTKPPISPHSNVRATPAKSNDAATWSDLTTALETARRLNLAGVGFCFSQHDGLTGVDIDHVIDTATGAIDPRAMEILQRFSGTYCEVSPSGTGIRIFCKGKPVRSGKNTGKTKWLEVYSHPSNRYLTVTGDRIKWSYTDVTDQQEALNWLHSAYFADKPTPAKPSLRLVRTALNDDDELIEKAHNARNGYRFRELWSGGGGDDASANDLALCNMLAFYTSGDPARIDRLFRRSGLMRPKWDEIHDRAGGRTYGQMTIDKAIAGTRNSYAPSPHNHSVDKHPKMPKEIADVLAAVSHAPRNAPSQSPDRPDRPDGLNPQIERRKQHRIRSATPNKWRGTDDGNAELLIELRGDDIRFVPAWGKWIIWDGIKWQLDETIEIDNVARDVVLDLRKAATRLIEKQKALLDEQSMLIANKDIFPDNEFDSENERITSEIKSVDAQLTSALSLSRKLESTAKRETMLLAARHRLIARHTDLDCKPFLLSAANCTLDLENGAILKHSRSHLITHATPVVYPDNPQSPTLWISFLNSIFAGDADLIAFVKRAIGYSLTGDVSEQVLFICHGSGSNGKSVFLNVLRALLGPLSIQSAPDMLMSTHDRHPTELADLFRKRLVVCQETADGRRFNESLVKQLTGGDAIRARRMREDFWQFEPTHKIWLSTNHKPEIRGTDHAIWRRIRLIPFNVTFSDTSEPRKNPHLEKQLLGELPAILRWAVDGALEWKMKGLGNATAVAQATSQYKQQCDVLAAWIEDRCVTDKNAICAAGLLYSDYVNWCEENGEYVENQRKFGMRLSERGFERVRSGAHFWRGIGLLQK